MTLCGSNSFGGIQHCISDGVNGKSLGVKLVG